VKKVTASSVTALVHNFMEIRSGFIFHVFLLFIRLSFIVACSCTIHQQMLS